MIKKLFNNKFEIVKEFEMQDHGTYELADYWIEHHQGFDSIFTDKAKQCILKELEIKTQNVSVKDKKLGEQFTNCNISIITEFEQDRCAIDLISFDLNICIFVGELVLLKNNSYFKRMISCQVVRLKPEDFGLVKLFPPNLVTKYFLIHYNGCHVKYGLPEEREEMKKELRAWLE